MSIPGHKVLPLRSLFHQNAERQARNPQAEKDEEGRGKRHEDLAPNRRTRAKNLIDAAALPTDRPDGGLEPTKTQNVAPPDQARSSNDDRAPFD
ncbi:hypothetical protein GCM10010973_17580 [Cribrihabitans marinus]|nr:hypothetical protein GCM10010973_17580 [Cribrihabitans marinus]